MEFAEQVRIFATQDHVSCDLCDEAAILHLKNGVYYGLNPVGARIWKLLQQPLTIGQLLERMLAEYDVDNKRLEADVRHLLGELAENDLIRVSP